MTKCPRCGYDAEGDTCLVCGQKIEQETTPEENSNDVDFQRPGSNVQDEKEAEEKIQETVTPQPDQTPDEAVQQETPIPEQTPIQQEANTQPQQEYNQQYNQQQQQYNQVPQQQYNNPANTNQQMQNPYNNNYQNGYNNYQQNQYQRPQNQKSKAIGLILNFIIVGGGYMYVGKWGEGIAILVIYIILLALAVLIFPLIIAIILWIYTLFKTNDMIDKYNAGMPY